MGFATNALNPKVAVLFVSLFTQVLGPHVSTGIKMLYGSEMVLFTLGWFLLLASVFAQMAEKQGFKSFLRYVGKITGVALIAFGIRLAFVRAH